MKLNETPVRTCRNYNINNIEFDEKILDKVSNFNNLKITKETEKDEVVTNFGDCNFDVKYGTGLIDQIKENSNQNIRVNINSKTDKEIKLEFDFDDENLNLVENIEIVAKENTNSNIYILYRQKSTKKAFHNGLIRVLLNKNSKSTITIVNLLNNDSSNILSVEN